MESSPYLSILAPELILAIGALFALVVGLSANRRINSTVAPVALIAVAIALWTALRRSNFPDSEIMLGLWFTPLTYYVRLIALSVGLLIVLVNWSQPVARERGEYMAMILLSLLGVLLTASANDLLVLFFAVELVSVPTYVLIALSRDDRRASEAAVKYFFLGALSAALFAYGISYLYGATGTTALYTRVGDVMVSSLADVGSFGSTALIGLLLVFGGLLFKVAAVPLHVYAADVYEGAASPVTGMLGFVPKLAGFVALAKLFTAFQWDFPVAMWWAVWLVAAATMTVGNVLGLLQHNVKRMLAYSSIAHTGYMMIALLVGPVAGQGPLSDGTAALLFYIAVYGAMNLGAFAVLSLYRCGERDMETLDDLGGLAKRSPAAALALVVCVFSLMGFPPTAGFVGKLYILGSALSLGEDHHFHGPLVALAVIGVINTAIGAAYYLRIVAAAYMSRESAEATLVGRWPARLGLGLCAAPMLLLFAWPIGLTGKARSATVVLRELVRRDRTSITESISDERNGSEVLSAAAGPMAAQ